MPFAALHFSPDGKVVAAGTGGGVIHLWDVEQRGAGWTRRVHSNWVFDLTYLPNGHLVSGGGDDLIRIIDSHSGVFRQTFDDHTNDLHGVAVTSDGKWLVSGGDDKRILARNLKDNKVVELGEHVKQVTSVTISPDDKWAASTSRDGAIKLWDLVKLTEGMTLNGHTADVMSIAFSPDASQLIAGRNDPMVRQRDAKTGQ